jgi:hypothetical protein
LVGSPRHGGYTENLKRMELVMKKLLYAAVMAVVLVLALAKSTFGQGAEIQNPGNPVPVILGINQYGSTNTLDTLGIDQTGSGYVGLAYYGVNSGFTGKPPGDSNSPGCQCEGWGVAANGVFGGSSDVSTGGVANGITLSNFTSTSSTASSTVTSNNLPLTVTNSYAPSAGVANNSFTDVVTIKNTGTTALNNVSYSRVFDFDVPPTEFNEFMTVQGNGTTSDLYFTNDNGFGIPDPTNPGLAGDIAGCGTNTNFTHCGPADHGAQFAFNFGTLAPGASTTFEIFYGADTNEASALGDLGALKAEAYALGQSATTNLAGAEVANTGSATFFFGFEGVGGEPIVTPTSTPEPGSLALLVSGLLGLGLKFFPRRTTQC